MGRNGSKKGGEGEKEEHHGLMICLFYPILKGFSLSEHLQHTYPLFLYLKVILLLPCYLVLLNHFLLLLHLQFFFFIRKGRNFSDIVFVLLAFWEWSEMFQTATVPDQMPSYHISHSNKGFILPCPQPPQPLPQLNNNRVPALVTDSLPNCIHSLMTIWLKYYAKVSPPVCSFSPNLILI